MRKLTAILFGLVLLLPSLASAQVATLQGTGEKIQVVLAGAKATVDATVHAMWSGSTGGPSTTSIATNGVTAVDVLVGINGPPKVVNSIFVSNTDTAAITLTIRRVAAATNYPIVSAVVLQVNDTLMLSPTGRISVTDSSGNERGTANASVVRTAQTYKVNTTAKVGTTAGWTVGAANNLGTIATVAASQSASTLVVRIDGLHVGDTITGFGVYSSINSAGGTVTLDAALRKLTIGAAASATDAAIGTGITQVSVTAATASSATKTGLTEVVATGTSYYLLLTATTAGSTTIELDSIEITVTSS